MRGAIRGLAQVKYIEAPCETNFTVPFCYTLICFVSWRVVSCLVLSCLVLSCVVTYRVVLGCDLSYRVVSRWSALLRGFNRNVDLKTDITFILFMLVLLVPSLIVWQIIRLRWFHSWYSNGSLMMKWNSVGFQALWIKSALLAWCQTVNIWRSNWQLY